VGMKSRGGWQLGMCLRDCKNMDKKCDSCIRFSEYEAINEKPAKNERRKDSNRGYDTL